MIPRTVLMAQEVAAQFTAAQVEEYGNIILNGYLSVVPNTVNKKAWQYKETTTAPVNLPSLTEVQPMYRGWTTNYMQYYTQLPPNAYSQVPGNPTMFEYVVDSFSPLQGPIEALAGFLNNGIGYTPGTYTATATTTSGGGSGATVDVVVNSSGIVTSITLVSPGTGYEVGDALYPVVPGGTGASIQVTELDLENISGGGNPLWAQAPRRVFQNQVSPSSPNPSINNSQVIQYSFMHPVADNPVPPPVDVL